MKSMSRILIADPNPDVCQNIQQHFEQYGHEIHATRNESEVVRKARLWQPNAIVMSDQFDAHTPNHLCDNIKRDALAQHIPLLILLEGPNKPMVYDLLELGVDSVLSSSVDLEELRLRVEALVRLTSTPVNQAM